MWCLCDWNISLQSTPMVLSLTEIASGLARTGFQVLQQVPKVVTECVEKRFARSAFGNWIGMEGTDGISGLEHKFHFNLLTTGNAILNSNTQIRQHKLLATISLVFLSFYGSEITANLHMKIRKLKKN